MVQIIILKGLRLWFETVDELFNGEPATRAKESAQKMATGQFLTIRNNRPKNENSADRNVYKIEAQQK
jgi:hemoglobin